MEEGKGGFGWRRIADGLFQGRRPLLLLLNLPPHLLFQKDSAQKALLLRWESLRRLPHGAKLLKILFGFAKN